MSTEMFTVLPGVTNVLMSDIICAVQGFISPSSPGISVQETMQQVFNLMLANIILNNAGNPNGVVAGNIYQLCWDTTDQILFTCTTSGSAVSAVWTQVAQSANSVWVNVTGATQSLAINTNYIANNAGGNVTFTLPASAILGNTIVIVGRQNGWSIAQNSGQKIIIGSSASTVGITGSISSTNAHDSVTLTCTNPNTEFTVRNLIGNITVV